MNKKPFIKIFLQLIACVGILLAAGCGKAASSELPEQIPTPEATLTITEAITMTATPSPTNTPIPTATATPAPTVTPTPTLSPTPTLVSVYDQILKLEEETEADPELPVKAALLVNISDSTVLYSDHATEVIYPASITKLMTALVVLDAEQDLTEMVQISKTAVTPVIPSAKMCGFKAGDFILYIDLLRSMLVYSGNDTSVALAEYMVGSEADFVALMNQKAEELGLRSSVFCNSHGLPDDNHVTSAYDIYLIMQKLFNFEEFLGIIESGSIEVEVLRGESIKTFHFESTNQFFTDKYQMPEGITMIGGKTGNTNKAGYCLALYVKDQSGDCYIAEIFGAKSREELFPSMIQLLTHISEE